MSFYKNMSVIYDATREDYYPGMIRDRIEKSFADAIFINDTGLLANPNEAQLIEIFSAGKNRFLINRNPSQETLSLSILNENPKRIKKSFERATRFKLLGDVKIWE